MEWYCYAALGVLTAFMSFCMDMTIAKLLRAHQWLYGCLEGNILLQFLCWTLYPACLCALSTSFSHSICPQSAGSGLPEIRTILSGVQLADYLSLSNLFAKLIGLISTLSAGSTVFLGKVGPFVHLSNMVGAYLYRLYASACGDKQKRTQKEMLVVASAVGVASCFGAPVSGAALGRFLGEGLAYLFPDGISSGERLSVINPGGYALVGAAAFAGAVTHTLSPALCALELTGQSTHVVPILTATLISNALARSRHQPSFYDGISLIKRLPHLPSLIRACPKQFVVPVGAVLQRAEGVTGVQHVLNSSKENEFPVVDTHDSHTLLGTVTRAQLQTFVLSNQSEDLCRSLEDECLIQPVTMQLSTDATVKQMKSMIEDLAKEF
ncbi:Chloride channel protein ClC-Kb [Bagarius yarrelli]|uniref:Chloride channel protein ClC-Kb n=1 Tax=Bagarius yarrelli TaxID=175774 RepID=A0A556V183_BAGYA|nr:Chloride channel protein ClC-Kb [Bagarius yarrelli]